MSGKEGPVTLKPPLKDEVVRKLRAGDRVEVTGTIVTARDKAYERILNLHSKGEDPPVDLEGGIVYHCGPLARRTGDGWEIVAAGPTTSARMDDSQGEFLKTTGAKAIVGKGGIGKKVIPHLEELGCVYLAFPGGAAALGSESIESVEDVFWTDLGTAEALWVLRVEGFGPLTVAVDTEGNDLYDRGQAGRP